MENLIENYRKAEGLNYSLLSAFRQSPSRAVMEVKENAAMAFGTAWHLYIQDHIKEDFSFHDHYFIVQTDKEMPDEIVAFASDWTGDQEELDRMYIYTKPRIHGRCVWIT